MVRCVKTLVAELVAAEGSAHADQVPAQDRRGEGIGEDRARDSHRSSKGTPLNICSRWASSSRLTGHLRHLSTVLSTRRLSDQKAGGSCSVCPLPGSHSGRQSADQGAALYCLALLQLTQHNFCHTKFDSSSSCLLRVLCPGICESESDNATEGVSWKARDLWSAPVEWSNDEMQERKCNEPMQSSAATIGGRSPSGGCWVMAILRNKRELT